MTSTQQYVDDLIRQSPDQVRERLERAISEINGRSDLGDIVQVGASALWAMCPSRDSDGYEMFAMPISTFLVMREVTRRALEQAKDAAEGWSAALKEVENLTIEVEHTAMRARF